MMKNILLIALIALTGFGCSPGKTPDDDTLVKALLEAAKSSNRGKHGFSPIQQSADFWIEAYGGSDYDVMLHFNNRTSDSILHDKAKTSRTVAFRKTPDGYKWVQEQEIFVGPNQFTTSEGTYYERIVLTYQTEKVSSLALNQLEILYIGRDSRLSHSPGLNEIKPFLKEWGY